MCAARSPGASTDRGTTACATPPRRTIGRAPGQPTSAAPGGPAEPNILPGCRRSWGAAGARQACSLSVPAVASWRAPLLSKAIALLHDSLDRVSPGRLRMARRAHRRAYGLPQRRRRPNVEIHLRGALTAHGAMPQPRREGVIQPHQPVLGTHTGTYGATSTVADTAWQRRQLTIRFPALYITSSALPCRHAGVSSKRVVRATCTTGV